MSYDSCAVGVSMYEIMYAMTIPIPMPRLVVWDSLSLKIKMKRDTCDHLLLTYFTLSGVKWL